MLPDHVHTLLRKDVCLLPGVLYVLSVPPGPLSQGLALLFTGTKCVHSRGLSQEQNQTTM